MPKWERTNIYKHLSMTFYGLFMMCSLEAEKLSIIGHDKSGEINHA